MEVAALFVVAVAKLDGDISAEQVDELRSEFGLSEADIFDIAAIASARCFFTKVLDAVGSLPDEALLKSNEDLTTRLFS